MLRLVSGCLDVLHGGGIQFDVASVDPYSEGMVGVGILALRSAEGDNVFT